MNVLYLSYTGLAEPLGQSQVIAYIRGLSGEHRITVISFEKPADLADARAMTALRGTCAEHGIAWIARRYHRRPRLLATVWDLAVLAWTAFRLARTNRAELVHARSLLPALVALGLKRTLGIPFIFDMRGFWPEELVSSGRLKRNSPVLRLLVWGESQCLRHADAVVSLTHTAVAHLKLSGGGDLTHARFAVIPTCVDLDRFRYLRARDGARPPVIGSIGSVASGWFRLDWLMTFFRACAEAWPEARFRVITRDDAEGIAAAAARAGLDPSRLEVERRTPDEIPQALERLDAVAMFFESAISELARCPTRMGEALAAGLPVVADKGVGDVADIIRDHRVGVVVEDASERSMRNAPLELGRLLQDPELAVRCRKTAEALFSLQSGVEAYRALYGEIANGRIEAGVDLASSCLTRGPTETA
jgi:glycosyltransferase involved in cell wall biosynthesis